MIYMIIHDTTNTKSHLTFDMMFYCNSYYKTHLFFCISGMYVYLQVKGPSTAREMALRSISANYGLIYNIDFRGVKNVMFGV